MSTFIKLLFATLVLGVCVALSSAPAEANLRGNCCPPPCPPPPPITIVLQVCHPCTGCKYDIPVCVPACCNGVPSVCFQSTLIGNGKTTFQWPSGHRVVVRYNHHGYRVAQH